MSHHPRRLHLGSLPRWRRWLAIGCLWVPLGCTPYAHQQLLQSGAIDASTYDTGQFKHRLFRASAEPQDTGKALHIYISGDGRPWRTSRLVAQDPTSARATLLKNMLQDEANSVYVGRPCYYQVADERCSANWWTRDRYHADVVASLLKTIKHLANPQQPLWLIGHSGGGSLAVLLGRRMSRPVGVVTVSANLDHRAWTTHHQYSPLTGSLNPMDDTARNPDMQELHWYATEDRNILPRWIKAYCQNHNAHCKPVAGNHRTGWSSHWPQLLKRSEKHFNSSTHSAAEHSLH